mgnify:CR=1 FL=1
MATLIKTDGSSETVVGKGLNRVLTLDQIQEAVDGYFQFAPTHGRDNVLVNEDGRMRGMKYNLVASNMAGQELVGPVLFCADSEIE